ncbi:MAG: Dabb family protein [Bacteroidota bacterium]
MTKVFLSLVGLMLFVGACQMESTPSDTKETTIAKPSLPKNGLVHAVYFDVLDSLLQEERSAFVDQLKRLAEVEGVYDFKVGAFQELGDPRALASYEWAILMTFTDSMAYRQYQQDPIHLEVKKAVGPYLAAKPASYDFMTQ